MGPEPITSRDIHVSSDDFFQICCYPRIREKIGGDVRRKINEQIHIAVGSAIASNDRSEDGNMNHASLPKFGFVGPELGEDAGEQRHIISYGRSGSLTMDDMNCSSMAPNRLPTNKTPHK